MAWNIGELLNDARSHLNDRTEPLRYTDADLVVYYNDALRDLKRLRPDAFFSMYGEELPTYTVDDFLEDIIVDEIFHPAMSYYIVGNAELLDDEFVTDGRVAGLLKQFQMKVMSVGA